MLDQLFRKLPTSSHARSESSPHLRHSLANSFYPSGSTLADNVFTDDLPVAPSRRGQDRGRGQLHRSFDTTILTEPAIALQHLGSAKPLTRDLPPLFTSPTNPSPAKRQNLEPDTDIHDFAYSPSRSPQHSPTRLKRLSISLLTGNHTELVRKEPSSNKLAGWFQGESSPINIGLLPSSPTKEKSDPLGTMPPVTKLTPVTPKPGLASRFSFFTTKTSPIKSPTDQDQDDEFLNLDISTALFPAGPADPFSPSSFKNLAQNAEGLTSRLQSAYRQRTISLRDMTAEKETIAEELEGAETRTRHLKNQLDDLSARVVEQDKAMMELVDELANLKRIRAEEEDARKRTIRPVQPSISAAAADDTAPPPAAADQEGTKPQRSRRDRLSSTSSATDDCESETESLWSKDQNLSPRMSLSSVETTGSPDFCHLPDLSLTAISPLPFQPIRRQTARVPQAKSQLSKEEGCVWSCANCQGGGGGGGAAEAWGVVGMLKEENRCLKERVEHVEGALEGCLDVVARLG